jgi:hypothetical protein
MTVLPEPFYDYLSQTRSYRIAPYHSNTTIVLSPATLSETGIGSIPMASGNTIGTTEVSPHPLNTNSLVADRGVSFLGASIALSPARLSPTEIASLNFEGRAIGRNSGNSKTARTGRARDKKSHKQKSSAKNGQPASKPERQINKSSAHPKHLRSMLSNDSLGGEHIPTTLKSSYEKPPPMGETR